MLRFRLFHQPVNEMRNCRTFGRRRQCHDIIGEFARPCPIESDGKATVGDFFPRIDIPDERNALAGDGRPDQKEIVVEGRAALDAWVVFRAECLQLA